MVPHGQGDGGAGFVVGLEVGEFVGARVAFAGAVLADTADEVELAIDHVLPDAIDGVDVFLFAGEGGHVGDAGVEVAAANGVSDGF